MRRANGVRHQVQYLGRGCIGWDSPYHEEVTGVEAVESPQI